jgi:MoaA/NifB/PqqE/SkfB family radical SAM enzyme
MTVLPASTTRTQVEIEFTGYCNAKCVACPRSKMPKLGFLSCDKLFRILDMYQAYRNPLTGKRARFVVAGGGEPLLHRGAVTLLRRIRARQFEVSLISNGSRLHKHDVHGIIENTNELLFSFWGIEPIEYFRSMKLDFKTSLANVEMAINLAKKIGTKVVIQYLRTPELMSSEDDIRAFWEARGVLDVRGGYQTWNRANLLPVPGRLLELSASISPDFERRIWCADLYFSDAFSWDGELIMCCCDYFNGKRRGLGNVESLDVDKIGLRKGELLESSRSQACKACLLPRRLRARQLAGEVLRYLPETERADLLYE